MSSFPWRGWGGRRDGYVRVGRCRARRAEACDCKSAALHSVSACVARVRLHRVAQCSSVSPHERARLLLLISAMRAAGAGKWAELNQACVEVGRVPAWRRDDGSTLRLRSTRVRPRSKPPALETGRGMRIGLGLGLLRIGHARLLSSLKMVV